VAGRPTHRRAHSRRALNDASAPARDTASVTRRQSGHRRSASFTSANHEALALGDTLGLDRSVLLDVLAESPIAGTADRAGHHLPGRDGHT
jgi:hypothetical protein